MEKQVHPLTPAATTNSTFLSSLSVQAPSQGGSEAVEMLCHVCTAPANHTLQTG